MVRIDKTTRRGRAKTSAPTAAVAEARIIREQDPNRWRLLGRVAACSRNMSTHDIERLLPVIEKYVPHDQMSLDVQKRRFGELLAKLPHRSRVDALDAMAELAAEWAKP